MINDYLIAIKASRREFTSAIFNGTLLQYAEVRHLSNDFDTADATIREFVNWLTEKFQIGTAALISADAEARANVFLQVAELVLQNTAVSLRRVAEAEVLTAFGAPALTNQLQLRSVSTQIWPQLNTRKLHRSVLDAAAAGLYVQVERLLNS